MKRTLLTTLLGLTLAASAGACICGGDETDTTDAQIDPKGADDATDKGKPPADGAQAPDGDTPVEPPIVPDGGPPAEAEGDAEGAEAEGADAEGAEAEGADAGGAEAEAEGAEAEGDAGAEEDKVGEGIPVKDLEPFEPGDVYKGPPSKALVGTWKISLPKSSIPKDLPKEERDKLKTLGDARMTFDGRKMTVLAGEKEESFTYKVTEEKGISLQISVDKGDQDELIAITFYDQDNILLNESRFPGPARGARAKDE